VSHDEDDTIEGDFEDSCLPPAPSPVAPAAPRQTSQAARAAEAAAHEAAKHAHEVMLEAAHAAERAREAKEHAERVAREASVAARRAAEEAERTRRDALRPPEHEYELEVVDTYPHQGGYRVVFLAHGAPNFARLKGATPEVTAWVGVPVSDFGLKALGSGEASMPRVPSNDDAPLFGKLPIPEASVYRACKLALKEHLDLVDRDRLSRTSAPARSRFKVKA